MTDQELHRLWAYLDERRWEMAELLQRLACAESPSDDKDAVAVVLDLLAPELMRSGMTVRRLRGKASGGTIFARQRNPRKGAPLQMLVGHCDTVWPVGTSRQMPVRNDGQTVWGPGVFDMKGGLVQMIFALRAANDFGLSLPANSVAVINSDEEIGSPDSTPLIRRLARRAVRAFVLEPAFGPTGKLKTARKATGSFTITIHGRAAHAGINPEDGASAILELSFQIQRLFALNNPERGITVNVGTVDGGLRSNVVAAEVKATVDVRVRTRQDAVQVETAIRALQPVNPNTRISVEGGIPQLPMEPSPRNQSLWRLAQKMGRQLHLELEQAAVGGSSDGNTISQYTATLDGLGAVGDGAHAAHEQASIAAMPERTALLVLLLQAPVNVRPADENAPNNAMTLSSEDSR